MIGAKTLWNVHREIDVWESDRRICRDDFEHDMVDKRNLAEALMAENLVLKRRDFEKRFSLGHWFFSNPLRGKFSSPRPPARICGPSRYLFVRTRIHTIFGPRALRRSGSARAARIILLVHNVHRISPWPEKRTKRKKRRPWTSETSIVFGEPATGVGVRAPSRFHDGAVRFVDVFQKNVDEPWKPTMENVFGNSPLPPIHSLCRIDLSRSKFENKQMTYNFTVTFRSISVKV